MAILIQFGGGDRDGRRSTSGYLFMFGELPFYGAQRNMG